MGRLVRIHVLHTNDVHSHFDQMPRIAALLRRMRRELEAAGDAVFVLDGGDHVDRMHPVTEGTRGWANVDVLNASGYDVVTVGNNEGITLPHEWLERLYAGARFDVALANLRDARTGERPPWAKPVVVREAGGVRVAFLGVTAPYHTFYNLLGWHVEEPEGVLAEQVRVWRERADLVVVLSHLGLGRDEELARSLSGVDLIVGAHTHHVLARGHTVGDTLIVQCGRGGGLVGHVRLVYDRDARRVVAREARCLPVVDEVPDAAVAEVIARREREADAVLSEPVAALAQPLPVSWERESPLANLLAAGLRRWVQADVALVNAGTLLAPLVAGPVTRRQLLAACPHPINPCRLTLTGEALRTILEDSLRDERIRAPIRGFGFRGRVHGWMCVDGLTVEYDPTAPEGSRIVRIIGDEGPLDPRREYRVATLDMFTFGPHFPLFHHGRDVRYCLPEFLRDVLQEALQWPEAVAASHRRRWVAVCRAT